jgi:hypothetical protein
MLLEPRLHAVWYAYAIPAWLMLQVDILPDQQSKHVWVNVIAVIYKLDLINMGGS